jgi:ligand-binding sensor domain-containing protein
MFLWPWMFLLLSAPAAFSQYRFDVLNTSNGLPQNTVDAILQTRDGYIWLTTFDGLMRDVREAIADYKQSQPDWFLWT